MVAVGRSDEQEWGREEEEEERLQQRRKEM